MQNKKQLLRRLMMIYIVYFAILLGGFVHQLTPIVQDFKAGMSAAAADFQAQQDLGIPYTSHFLNADLRPEIVNAPSDNLVSGNTSVDIAYSKADLKLTVRNGRIGHGLYTSFAFDLAAEIAQLSILVLMGIIIYSLRRSIRNEQPLSRVNIVRTRWIGVLILAAELFKSLSDYIDNKAAAILLAGTNLTVNTSFNISYWSLFMGILVLFTAEVFALGHKLGEEQKLTI